MVHVVIDTRHQIIQSILDPIQNRVGKIYVSLHVTCVLGDWHHISKYQIFGAFFVSAENYMFEAIKRRIRAVFKSEFQQQILTQLHAIQFPVSQIRSFD